MKYLNTIWNEDVVLDGSNFYHYFLKSSPLHEAC